MEHSLSCRSTDCRIKDSELGSGLGMCLPFCSYSPSFSGYAVLLTLVCLAFVNLPSICQPVFCVSTIWSVLPITAHDTLACRAPGLEVPLASEEPFRFKTYSYSFATWLIQIFQSWHKRRICSLGLFGLPVCVSCPLLPISAYWAVLASHSLHSSLSLSFSLC